MSARLTWDQYFLDIAKVVASRSTCPRASVGAVIVRDNRIISTGYNGAAAGNLHCTNIGCDMYYWDSLGRESYSCIKCTQVMAAAGIVNIIGRRI
jgi:dCMP deaminase